MDADAALRDAVDNEDFAGMQRALEAGAHIDCNDMDSVKHTALMDAAHKCPPEFSAFLVDAGADVNARDMEGCTALVHAVTTECIDTVRLFIGVGADCNAVFLDGYRPLHVAALVPTSQLCSDLLKAGADAQVCNKKGMTPFQDSISRGLVRNIIVFLAASGLHQPQEAVGWSQDDDDDSDEDMSVYDERAPRIVIFVDGCPCCTCPDCGRPYEDHSDDEDAHSNEEDEGYSDDDLSL